MEHMLDFALGMLCGSSLVTALVVGVMYKLTRQMERAFKRADGDEPWLPLT